MATFSASRWKALIDKAVLHTQSLWYQLTLLTSSSVPGKALFDVSLQNCIFCPFWCLMHLRKNNWSTLRCPYDQILDIYFLTFSYTIGLSKNTTQVQNLITISTANHIKNNKNFGSYSRAFF